jgi:hypothetical protein
VAAFDEASGLGEIDRPTGAGSPSTASGSRTGSRTIHVGATVEFELMPKLGRYEATAIRPAMSDADRERRIVDVIRRSGPG